MEKDKNENESKYLRRIVLKGNPTGDVLDNKKIFTGLVDVYAVLDAFGVTCSARAHAVKKLLCPGERGEKDRLRDIKESKDSIIRAYEMEQGRIICESLEPKGKRVNFGESISKEFISTEQAEREFLDK